MARGVDGRETFADNRDRQLFLTALTEIKRETPFTLFAYCLMGNHFHLAIKVGVVPLSQILQRLLTRYVSIFNHRHDRTGHLFQARYKAVLCVDAAYLLRLIAYIHDNPVRSGLAVKNEDWEWSSSGAYLENRRTSLVEPDALPLTLGLDHDIRTSSTDDFEPWPTDARTTPVLLRSAATDVASLESAAASAAASMNLGKEALRAHRRDPALVRAKQIFITNSLQQGHTLTAISQWLKCTPAAVHYFARRRAH
ncbi:MAG: hypothetical protein A2V88_17110 [Elusimicrobia bacterium RBG_16_66_12]|nr:MAG: hypothetical protein A2V88_17110 [Elusimicrobia bacterium RBG_16_66_12]